MRFKCPPEDSASGGFFLPWELVIWVVVEITDKWK